MGGGGTKNLIHQLKISSNVSVEWMLKHVYWIVCLLVICGGEIQSNKRKRGIYRICQSLWSFLAFKTQNAARTVFWVWHACFRWSCHQWVGVVRKTWDTNWRYRPTYPSSECWSTCTGSSACSSSVEEKFNQTKAKVGSTGSANNRDPSDRKNRTGDVSADEWVLIFLFLICCWYYEKKNILFW